MSLFYYKQQLFGYQVTKGMFSVLLFTQYRLQECELSLFISFSRTSKSTHD